MASLAAVYAALSPLLGPVHLLLSCFRARLAPPSPALKWQRTRYLWGAVEREMLIIRDVKDWAGGQCRMQTSEEWYVKYFDTQLNRGVETRRMPNRDSAVSQARDLERLGHRVHSIVGPTGETPWEQIK